jgi:hypothetical protein
VLIESSQGSGSWASEEKKKEHDGKNTKKHQKTKTKTPSTGLNSQRRLIKANTEPLGTAVCTPTVCD